MNDVINHLRKNSILTVISAILIGFAIIKLSSLAANPITKLLENELELNLYTKNVFLKFFILVFAIIAILMVNKGRLTNYGFIAPKDFKFFRSSLIIIGITIGSMIFGSILFMGILNHLFPTGNSTGFPEQKSIVEMILTVWIWSSLCEEVLVRGFVQGFIQNLKNIKIFKISLPILISGLFFGSMHLSLLSKGMGEWFVAFIVFNTTIIGLLAAYYREKTESLIPAFWVHFLANFVGSIPLIIKLLIS